MASLKCFKAMFSVASRSAMVRATLKISWIAWHKRVRWFQLCPAVVKHCATGTTLLVHLEYRETRGQPNCSAVWPGGTEARQDANSRSTEIFPRLGNASPRAAKRTRPFSGGYDLLWLFGAPLANKSRWAGRLQFRLSCVSALYSTLQLTV
jgi:hypothetical protein